ncbi:ComF family protein [Halalkalibacter alkaliphilus]|uniref:ComF family protein n=1 Tax=Halalkalibacter alkaliphilus TaxID=2917993 RepID=A0A9X2CRP6_9BACI|nr:ComF family protein [Halalkalibacter alkaliphilus]MCL7746744.1 ComF family protein [Halalkalibacter alkaliphilus]
MNRCLACHGTYYDQPGWRRLLMIEQPSQICQTCESKLVLISGCRCIKCSRSMDQLSQTYRKGEQCLDCWRWGQQGETIWKNLSIYEYNAFLKEWLATFKFRGDAIIASFFTNKLANIYEKHFQGYVPVPIPLSKERLCARGFNQSSLLMKGWADAVEMLVRTEGEKQSKKNRKQRIRQFKQNPFLLKDGIQFNGENILLIDDIYTTGTTVRQAARVLKEKGAAKVASLTVAR